jgi:flagellar motor switch protein FliM
MPAADTVLTRKLRHGGVARSPLPDTGLIGAAFARHAEDRLRGLIKCTLGADLGRCRVTRLGVATGEIASPAMLGLLAVEDADTPALLALDGVLSWHLIDLSLGGDAGAPASPVSRPFTAIDMAVCRLHLEALVEAFGEAVATSLGRPLPRAVTIRDQRHTLSQLRLAPDYIDVLELRLDMTIGEAGRTGRITLVLPLSTLDVIRAAVDQDGAAHARERPNDLWRAAMRRAAATAPVTLDAVLHRDRMTLAALERLAPGDLIEIPGNAPQEVQITLGQPGGRAAVLALAQLGAYQGRKVLKLRVAPDPRVAAHVTRALRPLSTEVPEVARLPAPRTDHGDGEGESMGVDERAEDQPAS